MMANEEELERSDKEAYSYKEALEQPFWLQKLSETVTLPEAVKFSTIVYMVLFFALYFFLFRFIPLLGSNYKWVGAVFAAWFSAIFVDGVEVDGKTIPIFIVEYLAFYFKFCMKKVYINKGIIYELLDEEEKEK